MTKSSIKRCITRSIEALHLDQRKLLTLGVAAVIPALHAATAHANVVTDVYAGGAGTYSLTGTVTSVLNVSSTANTFTLSDGTGSVIFYSILKTAYTATVGDSISVTAPNTPYQGAPEFVGTSGSFSGSILSQGNSVTYPVITVPQFVAAGTGSGGTAVAPTAESIVTLDNVYLPAGTATLANKTSYVLSDGTNTTTMYTYTSDSAVTAALAAANAANTASSGALYAGPLDITGYVDVYFGVPEIYPISITAGAPVPEPTMIAGLPVLALGLLRRRR
jgi:hypothetical protein